MAKINFKWKIEKIGKIPNFCDPINFKRLGQFSKFLVSTVLSCAFHVVSKMEPKTKFSNAKNLAPKMIILLFTLQQYNAVPKINI